MIRPLRQLHRRAMITLACVLPLALAVGVTVRKPVPAMAALPAGLLAVSPNFPTIQWERDGLFPKSPVCMRLRRESASAGHFAVELLAAPDFVKPDLLVYWATGNSPVTDTLPDHARLLGVLGAIPVFPLPDSVTAQPGVLVLFSLADNEIVDTSQPINCLSPNLSPP